MLLGPQAYVGDGTLLGTGVCYRDSHSNPLFINGGACCRDDEFTDAQTCVSNDLRGPDPEPVIE